MFMETILAIKATKTKLGKPVIIVETASKTHWVAYGMWTAHGNSENLEAYVGGNFAGDYFKKGDELLNGDVAQDDDVILRDFSATMNPAVLAGAIAAENAAKARGFNDAAAIFRKRRNDLLAEKAAKDAVLNPEEA